MFRLLKKLQMRGVEKRGMRRIFVYAAVTSFDANKADGLFQQPANQKMLKNAPELGYNYKRRLYGSIRKVEKISKYVVIDYTQIP